MKYQASRSYVSNDVVMTPKPLVKALVEHFQPQGKGLEPCAGCGNILEFLPNVEWCEIEKGRDFYEYNERVDYIFTNPPWSQIRKFLAHSMDVANEVYFLITINHLWTKARLKDIENAGFQIAEICVFDTPKNFPQSGFQVGMIHLKKGIQGDIKYTRINYENK